MNRKLALRARRRFGAGSLAALALLAGAAGCGSDGARSTGGAAANASPADPAVHVVGRASTAQRRAFALLRTAPEAVPRRLRRYVRPPAPGANLLLAQRIRVAFADTYWLVPADGYLCIVRRRAVDDAVVTTCTPTAQALRHGVVMTTLMSTASTPLRLILGVAPDGASQARIRTGRDVLSTPVKRTLFVARDGLADPPDRIGMR